jgi:hypothetical protein
MAAATAIACKMRSFSGVARRQSTVAANNAMNGSYLAISSCHICALLFSSGCGGTRAMMFAMTIAKASAEQANGTIAPILLA